VKELEEIRKLLRRHPKLQHLKEFLTIGKIIPTASPASIIALPVSKRHRGGQTVSNRWRVGDALDSRKGGKKILTSNIKNRLAHFDKKLKGIHDLTSARLFKEEKELSDNTASGGRKCLIFSIENAKKESLSPTKMAETLDDALEGLLVTTAYIKFNKIILHIYIYD